MQYFSLDLQNEVSRPSEKYGTFIFFTHFCEIKTGLQDWTGYVWLCSGKSAGAEDKGIYGISLILLWSLSDSKGFLWKTWTV